MLGFGIFDDHKNTSRRKEYEGYKYDSGPEVTIDGKSIAYRDPKNAKHVDSSNRGAVMRGPSINKDAYRGEAFDELYKYDHGTIADAMRANNITNLNNVNELTQTLDTIKGRFAGTGPVDETKKGKRIRRKIKRLNFLITWILLSLYSLVIKQQMQKLQLLLIANDLIPPLQKLHTI